MIDIMMSCQKNLECFTCYTLPLCVGIFMAHLCRFSLNTFSENCMLFFIAFFNIMLKKASEFFEFQKFCNLYVSVNTYKQNVSDNIWLCCCVLWYAAEAPSFTIRAHFDEFSRQRLKKLLFSTVFSIKFYITSSKDSKNCIHFSLVKLKPCSLHIFPFTKGASGFN